MTNTKIRSDDHSCGRAWGSAGRHSGSAARDGSDGPTAARAGRGAKIGDSALTHWDHESPLCARVCPVGWLTVVAQSREFARAVGCSKRLRGQPRPQALLGERELVARVADERPGSRRHAAWVPRELERGVLVF